MFDDALKYPVNYDDSGDYIIGGVLYFIAVIFVLPYVLIYGYLMEVLRTTVNGSEKPPSFSDISYVELALDGLKYAGIYLLYLSVPIILYFVSLYYGILPESILVMILWVSIMILNYIMMASVLVFSNNTLKDAFKPSLLKPILLSKEYLIATFIIITVGIVFSITMMITILILVFIPIIGWLILLFGLLFLPVIAFLYVLFQFRLYGLAYKKILNKNNVEDVEDVEE